MLLATGPTNLDTKITPGTMTSGTPQEHMGQTVPHLISRQLSPTLTVSPEAPT